MRNENFKNKIGNFKNCVGNLKEKMHKILRMCDSTDFKQTEAFEILQDGLINILDIKALNSHIQKDIEGFKESTNKEKESVEEKNLNYQNYLYQKENILSNINSCVNYPTVEMNKINILSTNDAIEFYKLKGINKISEELKTGDLLECELEIRKQLDEKVNTLYQEKETNQVQLKDKEKFLKELPDYFSNFETNTLKAQNFLNLNITHENENVSLSGKLPPPLYVIYNSLICLDKKCLNYDVNILGKSTLVDEFYRTYPISNINFNSEISEIMTVNREEGEHSDDGEINENESVNSDKTLPNQKLKFILTRRKQKLATNKKLIQDKDSDFSILKNKIKKFPLYVQLTINQINNSTAQNFPISINFYYIPVFNLVTTEVISKFQTLNTNSLLSNIFMPPKSFISGMKNEINSALENSCDEFVENEKVFDYIQILSNNSNYNLPYLNQICKQINKHKKITTVCNHEDFYYDDPNVINMSIFIENLSNRINNFPTLLKQLDYTTKTKSIPNEVLIEIKKDKRYSLIKERTTLIDCTQITQQDYLNVLLEKYSFHDNASEYKVISIFELNDDGNYTKKYIKAPTSIYSEDEALYYKISFERKSVKISAFVEIGFDYPINNPKFILTLENENNPGESKIPVNLQHLVSEENKNLMNFSSSNSELINSLNDIETEINYFYTDFCPETNMPNLLSYQIKNIQLFLDIAFEIESGNGNEFIPVSKSSKGIKKKKPLCFNSLLNIFEPR